MSRSFSKIICFAQNYFRISERPNVLRTHAYKTPNFFLLWENLMVQLSKEKKATISDGTC